MTNVLCSVVVLLSTNVHEDPIYDMTPRPGPLTTIGKREVHTTFRHVIWQGGGWGPFTNSEVIQSRVITYEYRPARTNVNFQKE
jgi:hypothetical protein